jgi:hypothetical protein
LKRAPLISVPLRVIVHKLANSMFCCDACTNLFSLWLRQAPRHLVRGLTQFQPTPTQQRSHHLHNINAL